MKMKFFVKSVLCLVMLTSLCCSCSDDSESWEELDAPIGEVLPKTDQLSVKLNLPTAVLGNNFKEAGSALVNRLTKNVSINDNSVRVVVLSAGALAFIVLYNLTNINITERIREIATIKVLGFRKGETAAYVFRENIFLTGISALLGLGLGRILLGFIISRINVDLISFDTRITGFSYALAVILTFVFAFIVSVAMSRRLENISMTESLKSIE